MVLVDTSVWISHFREDNPKLRYLLEEGRVMCHPFIIGELACGNLKNRKLILSLLEALPTAKIAEHKEVMQFIEQYKLMGRGLGYIDVHLLASVFLTGIRLWTLDKRLKKAAQELNCYLE